MYITNTDRFEKYEVINRNIQLKQIINAKFFFKNKKTGKVITKTSKNGGYAIKVNLVNGYLPYKVTVWYKDKIKA